MSALDGKTSKSSVWREDADRANKKRGRVHGASGARSKFGLCFHARHQTRRNGFPHNAKEAGAGGHGGGYEKRCAGSAEWGSARCEWLSRLAKQTYGSGSYGQRTDVRTGKDGYSRLCCRDR